MVFMQQQNLPDPHELLGVSRDATRPQILGEYGRSPAHRSADGTIRPEITEALLAVMGVKPRHGNHRAFRR